MDPARPGRAVRLGLPLGVAVVLFGVGWPTAHVELGLGAATAMVAGLAAAAPVALAGVAPVAGWALSALGAAVVGASVSPGVTGLTVPIVHLVALLGLLLVAGTLAGRWTVALAGVGTAVLVHQLLAPGDLTLGAAVLMVLVVASLLRQVRGSREALAREREVGEHERELRVLAEERARIARDLHDVVAHSMSLVVVRAQSARHRVPGTSDAVAAELGAIADTARAALAELRGVLGVLRTEDGRSDRPQPGAAEVEDLLASTRAAGVDLTVTRVGVDLAEVGPGVTLSLHRILAEALANAARHAGGAPVAVHLEHGHGTLRLRVANPPGSDVAGPGAGLGLTAMRERATAVGGELTAGPGAEGFVVEATLPVAVARVPA